MDESDFMILHCKASDWNAATGVCSAPFYAPAPKFFPDLPVADSIAICAQIAAMWCIGFVIKTARKPTNY